MISHADKSGAQIGPLGLNSSAELHGPFENVGTNTRIAMKLHRNMVTLMVLDIQGVGMDMMVLEPIASFGIVLTPRPSSICTQYCYRDTSNCIRRTVYAYKVLVTSNRSRWSNSRIGPEPCELCWAQV